MVCELCGKKARMYCESDQAKLCWDCDGKVHGANFLVAKHSRNLLCRTCKSPTPWKACGPKLMPTLSVCEACVAQNNPRFDGEDDKDEAKEEEDDSEPYSSDSDFEEEEGDDEEEEEEGENQVVPLSSNSTPPPPRVTSFTSSDGEISSASGGGGLQLKRRLTENSMIDSDEEFGCTSSQMPSMAMQRENATSVSSFRYLKQPRIKEPNPLTICQDQSQARSRSSAIMRRSSVMRLPNERVNEGGASAAAANILGINTIPRNQNH